MNRFLNFFLALVMSILLIPVFIIVAVVIKIDSAGPVIFKQRRIGLHGKEFVIWKFRTMAVGMPDLPSDQVSQSDRRFTKVGKWLRRTSLDELPQLYNIIRGEMNFVGPRPALYNQYDLNRKRQASGVHAVPPGITGWAQINGRDDVSDDEKVAFDTYYVTHKSLLVDLKIIFLTFATVTSARGLYRSENKSSKKVPL